jgi:tetratricopeptide (TPR) repeat protein
VKDYLVEVFSAADPQYESGEALTALELVERGASRIGQRFEDDPAVRTEITRVLASVLNGLGRYDRADAVLSPALPEIRRLDDPAGLFGALQQLHAAAHGAGANDSALARAREMLDLSRRAFGEDDERTLTARQAIALSLQSLGRLGEAGSLYRDLIAEATRRGAGSRADLARLRLDYGAFLYETGDYPGAEEQTRIAADGFRRADDAAHEVEALSALGDIVGMQDRPDEALEVLRRAVAAARVEYGEADGHPVLAGCLVNLGGVLRDLGRHEEAEAAFREAADMYIATLGGDHWLVGRAYVNLANAKTGQGDLEEAGRLLDEAVRIMTAALGENHPALGAPLTQRARNLLNRGLLDEAEAAYRETLAMHRATFGNEHPYTSYPAEGLAGTLERLGRLEEAEALRREVLEIRTGAFGPSHSVTVDSRFRVALVLARRAKTRDAARELDTAAEDGRKGLPATAGVLSDVLLERARLGRRIGDDPDDVRALLAEALEIRAETFGPDDDRTGEVRDELAAASE